MDLSGKTVGLLENTKVGAVQIIEDVFKLLSEGASGVRVKRARKPNMSVPYTEANLSELKGADAVITGLGD